MCAVVVIGGTRQGGAYGFQLETLTKLRNAKSTDHTSNLLNFLVAHIQKKSPEVSAFVNELTAVKTSSRVESGHVAKQIQRIQKHLKQLAKAIRKREEMEAAAAAANESEAVATPPVLDRFLPVMKEFYARSSLESRSLDERQIQLTQACHELASFFGARHLTKWEELFRIFDDFLNDYQAAERFLEATRIREEAKMRRQQAQENKQKQIQKVKQHIHVYTTQMLSSVWPCARSSHPRAIACVSSMCLVSSSQLRSFCPRGRGCRSRPLPAG